MSLFSMARFLSFCLCLIAFIHLAAGTKIPSHVIELNDNFLDIMDGGMWFVEFYAPWCAHCKKLMPVWEHMAHALADRQSRVRVGKLDCTRFSSVASTLRIHGYPTIIFFRNGVQIHYEGERRKEALLKFAEKCAGPVIDRINSREKFADLAKTSDRELFFVFYDPALRAEEVDSSEQLLWRQYENVSESFFSEVNFYEVRDKQILLEAMGQQSNRTKVIVVKDLDNFVDFDGKIEDLQKWVAQQRWPFLPQITASNIHSISEQTGKKLVLIPLDEVDRLNGSTASGSQSSEWNCSHWANFVFDRFFKVAKQAAADARADAELSANFQFGWMDGNQIVNGIVMGNLDIPNLLVFNMSSYEFYLSDDQPDQMTASSVLLFLSNVQQGNVEALGGRAWITRLKRMAYEITSNVYDMFQHQPILTVCLFGVPLAFFSIIAYSICSADFSVERDEIFPDDNEEDDDGLQDEEDDFTLVRPEAIEEYGQPSAEYDNHEKAD